MNNQPHIVITWELGSGYGHASMITALSLNLIKNNIQVSVITKELGLFYELSLLNEVKIYQAPIWPKIKDNKTHLNVSDILFDVGYKNTESLVIRLKAWQSLFKQLQPDLIICNFSPTAVIASHSLNVPVSILDTGFGIPTQISPMQNLRLWESQSQTKLIQADADLLCSVNKACKKMGMPQYKEVKELFYSGNNVLCTFPELDPYVGRGNEPYWGSYYNINKGVKLTWKTKKRKRVIVYLKAGMSQNTLIIEALKKDHYEVIIHVNGETKANLSILGEQFQFSEKAINLKDPLKSADLVITTAGLGLITASLIHGTPLLLLPINIEQKNNTLLVQQMGAGIEFVNDDTQQTIDEKIEKLVTTTSYKGAAQIFKEKYKYYDAEEQIKVIARHYKDELDMRCIT